MVRTITTEVEAAGASATVTSDNLCRAVSIPESSWTVDVAKSALRTIGIEARAVFITGFTDASIYNNHGIEMAVVGIGAQNEHSTDEQIAVSDMEKAVATLLEIFRLSVE
jgi:tripeptide aminopeptidase